MTENNRHLTFSQRNDLAPIPQPLKLGEISDKFRKDLWDAFYSIIIEDTGDPNLQDEYNELIISMLKQTENIFFGKTLDEIVNENRIYYYTDKYKEFFLKESFNIVFDFLEYFLKTFPKLSSAKNFIDIFKNNLLAYTIVDEECPTIVPAATPEEGETIRQAFEAAKEDKYEPVRKHLRNSAEQINANLPADAIRESIHAVESVLRIVTGESDFNKALQKLETSHRIHPALKDAFKKLYAYTSDEQGIRHALVDQPASPAGMDEAVFMLGTCAAFVGYVIRKS